MIKEHYICEYISDVVQTINKKIPGDGVVCLSPLPTNTIIYFDDETTRPIPLLTDIPIYRNFEEFTIVVPITMYGYLHDTAEFSDNINVIVVTKPNCLPSAPQNRIFHFTRLQVFTTSGWIELPHNHRIVRISSNAEGGSSWKNMEIRSIFPSTRYSILGYMTFYWGGEMTPVCEFNHVKRLGFGLITSGISQGAGQPYIDIEVFT